MSEEHAEIFVHDGTNQKGPFSKRQIRELIGQGELPRDILVWCDGMSDWQPASRVLISEPTKREDPAPVRATPRSIFFSVLCALLVAMAIGYGVWRHERWVSAKNQLSGFIHSSYRHAGDFHSGNPETDLAVLTQDQKQASEAARNLVALFDAKWLPLTPSERKERSTAQRIVDQDDFRREEGELFSKILDAKSNEERDKEVNELTALYERHGGITEAQRENIRFAEEEASRR